MQNGPQKINSPEEAVAQIQAIFTKYIAENKGWKDKAEIVRSEFYTTFHLSPDGAIPPTVKLSLDDMKKYVTDIMCPQFISRWVKLVSAGWSHLRTDLENAAKSWPTQLQYMEKQFESMQKRVQELEAEVTQLKAPKKPELPPIPTSPDALVVPLQQIQIVDDNQGLLKQLNDRLVQEMALLKAQHKELQDASKKAPTTEAAPVAAPVLVPAAVTVSSGAAITHQHDAQKNKNKNKRERRAEARAAATPISTVPTPAQPKIVASPKN